VLLSYLQQELLPRAQAEEETLYPAAIMLPGMSPRAEGQPIRLGSSPAARQRPDALPVTW
jgi:hypothetical protein